MNQRTASSELCPHVHPDSGGSPNEFLDVNLAYTVLSDPERRAHYDRTGEVRESEPDNTEQGALGLIGIMLDAALSSDTDPIECDLVARGANRQL